MTCFKIAGLALALSFSSLANANTYQFVGTDNTPETKFCVSVGNNDIGQMKSKLLMMGKGLSDVRRNINTINCNDLSAAKFAFKYQAHDTFKYLNERSMGKNRVRPTVTIRDIAKVDKATDTPIVVYVSNRLK
ncbi:hypothetical protein HR45_12625 [Shewanella mangrovi]|uniref:DUF3718 domain-containing protein n=1 Tax=Shewanella mangrovi TaxID=1515746 RepID=A0A094JXB6_9GAMM|nr:DUF3718 domain-containing protein [Shewanella mangrovi]KFZ37076.1 hypothetical protein HR45_12625 [Shewanella mangrovi]